MKDSDKPKLVEIVLTQDLPCTFYSLGETGDTILLEGSVFTCRSTDWYDADPTNSLVAKSSRITYMCNGKVKHILDRKEFMVQKQYYALIDDYINGAGQ